MLFCIMNLEEGLLREISSIIIGKVLEPINFGGKWTIPSIQHIIITILHPPMQNGGIIRLTRLPLSAP